MVDSRDADRKKESHVRYLMQNLDWLSDALGEFEDDYVRLLSLALALSALFWR